MTVNFTGTLRSGSTSITDITTTTGLIAGLNITGTGIPAGATIQTVDSATGTITLSAQATASGSKALTATFGTADVVPFQGDFDGDGLADLAYYVPSTATWYEYDSQSKTISSFVLGGPNLSLPVTGYFNANGPDELAVFTQGVWQIANASSSSSIAFGQAGDIPVPGDYTGVGYDELAVYRPSTGQFLVQVPVR